MEELEYVGNQLQAVLDQYLNVCTNMDDLTSHEGVPRNVPQRYLDHLGTEIARFSSHQQALIQTEAAVCRVRNRVSRLTPISSLPPEILTHIFHLVANPCDLLVPDFENSESSTSSSLSEYSDSSDSKRPHSKVLRLENFPSRPSHPRGLPIELHAADDSPTVYHGAPFRQLLSSIRNRVKSLDITVNCGWRRFHELVLEGLFPDNIPHSQPTILTKLTTNFPMAGQDTGEFLDWFDNTNDGLFHLTVLHLRGLFPLWGSTAYHNLVDLRLISASNMYWTSISEQELQDILKASPGLRILHFALRVIDRQGDDASTTPVRLNDLEMVSISTNRGVYGTALRPGDVLRLLAPGLKPLLLSIWHRYYISYQENVNGNYDGFSLDELVKFFQRSRVTKFHTKDGYPGLDKPLHHTPNLEDLAFEDCTILERDTEFPP